MIGFDDYVSFPAVLAAKFFGIRTLVFEPNAKAGVANRYLARVADKTVSILAEAKEFGIHSSKFIQKY